MNSPRASFNFNRLPVEIQREVIKYMELKERSQIYKTSKGIPRVPYNCCDEPTIKEVTAYLVKQIGLLRDPKTNRLNDWGLRSDWVGANDFKFIDNNNESFNIQIDGKGNIIYRSDYDYEEYIIDINKLVEFLSESKVSTEYIRHAIELFRPILYNRLSCMYQDPEFADKCLLKILSTYLNNTNNWQGWQFNIDALARLVRNENLFHSQVESQLNNWRTAGGRLKFNSVSLDQKVNGNLVKQWLTNWIRSLTPNDLKPLFPHILQFLPLPPVPQSGPLISNTFPNIPPPPKLKQSFFR